MNRRERVLVASRILVAVAHVEMIDAEEIFTATRRHPIVHARMVACWLLREITGCSYPMIGALLVVDHTTAMHACKRVSTELQTYGPLADLATSALDFLTAEQRARMRLRKESSWPNDSESTSCATTPVASAG